MGVRCAVCGEEVTCPNCGAEITTKSKMGEGTQSAKKAKRININKINLLKLFLERKITYPVNIYEISKLLFQNEIKRKRKDGYQKGWNYHDIQADMSMLVGLGLVKLSNKPQVWLADPEYMEWEVDQKPRYWIVDRIRAQKIVDNGGRIV